VNKGRSLAVAALFASTLAACGGGSGDASPVAASSPSAAPAAAGGPAATPGSSPSAAPASSSPPAPAPSAAAFAAYGPVLVAPDLVGEAWTGSPPPSPTAVARLADGGSVVAWRSQGQLGAQLLDATGALRGMQIVVPTARITQFAVTALAGGDWVLVWSEFANNGSDRPVSVNFRRYGADGRLVQDTTAATTSSVTSVLDLSATATADGGFAFAWVAAPQPPAPDMVYVARFGPTGNVQVPPAFPFAGADKVRIVALPDNTTVHATTTFIDAGGASHWAVVFHHLDAAGQEIGTPHPVVEAPPSQRLDFDMAVTTEGRIGLAWTLLSGSPPAGFVTTQLLESSGVPIGSPVTSAYTQIDRFSVGQLADGSFGVYVQAFIAFNRGSSGRLAAITVDANGAQGPATLLMQRSLSSVSPTTGATTGPATFGFGVATGPDGHAVISYERAVIAGAELVAEAQ
jgi:hypothetical protein